MKMQTTEILYAVHVEKLPQGRAGAPIKKHDHPTNERYQGAFYDAANIYAPFTSQLDWEVAKWGKMRGSSSTAFDELLAIDEVSALLPSIGISASYMSVGEGSAWLVL